MGQYPGWKCDAPGQGAASNVWNDATVCDCLEALRFRATSGVTNLGGHMPIAWPFGNTEALNKHLGDHDTSSIGAFDCYMGNIST